MDKLWKAGAEWARLITFAHPAEERLRARGKWRCTAEILLFIKLRGRFQFKRNSFLNEQSGDVSENKGSTWKSGGKSGMSMKTHVLSYHWRECC